MYSQHISALDTHTEGDPTRFILSGIPFIPGSTMVGKLNFFQKNLDHVRKFLMQEPRGHRDMFGAAIVPPVTPDSAFGIIFMDNGGYLNMCGHGIIAAATVGKKLGMISKEAKAVKIDSPAGQIEAEYVDDGHGGFAVKITSVPSFVHCLDKEIKLNNGKTVNVDIAFGGSFFAFVQAEALGIDEQNYTIDQIRDYGMMVKDAVNSQVKVQHPVEKHIDQVDLVEILFKPKKQGVDCKNILIFGEGIIGRDPCATGATAKLAIEYSKGKLQLNQNYVVEGLIETTYTCNITGTTKVGELDAVIPVIVGKTYITSFAQFVVESDDPLPTGWLV